MTVSVYEEANRLLQAQKSVAGNAVWTDGPYQDWRRWKASLIVDGEVSDMNLVIDAYPSSPTLRFVVLLTLGRCIYRLDGWLNDRHRNHPLHGHIAPPEIEMGWLFGPHCHCWEHNKHLTRNNQLPEQLEYAISLPANVQGFENSLRWFLGRTNVEFGPREIPDLPPRERLL